MFGNYKLVHRPWRVKKPVYFVMAFELLGLIAVLIMTGLAQPDTYRTQLWQIGFDNHFNSNPNMILYALANHRPPPNVPFVWSQTLTNLNVAIAVISLFVLLTKMIGFIMHVWYPVVGIFFSLSMTVLYTVSVYGQAGPDYADSRYPSPVAWYIAKSCDPAIPSGGKSSCLMAKGTFAVTCYMLFIYLVNFSLAVWSMLPNKELDMEDDSDDEAPAVSRSRAEKYTAQVHTTQVPPSPFTPFTPRTQAFHTLDRKLPLRAS